jgi:hypothetical protein
MTRRPTQHLRIIFALEEPQSASRGRRFWPNIQNCSDAGGRSVTFKALDVCFIGVSCIGTTCVFAQTHRIAAKLD